MIRKVLVAFVMLYIVCWLLVAHLVKTKTFSILNSFGSDNIKISYSDYGVYGFPFKFIVEFDDFKLILIHQSYSKEVSVHKLKTYFAFDLKTILLDLGKNVEIKNLSQNVESSYFISSKSDFHLLSNINKSIIYSDKNRWQDIIDDIIFEPNTLHISDGMRNLGDVVGLKIKLSLTSLDNSLSVFASSSGRSMLNKNIFNMSDFDFVFEGEYASGDNLDYKIDIKKYDISFGGTRPAFLNMVGRIRGAEQKILDGKMSFRIENIDDLIEYLLPTETELSKSYLKKFILKASGDREENDAKLNQPLDFDLIFFDDRIKIGNLTFLK